MRYLSPAFLFDGSIPATLDKKAILLGRKKLLAELELNAGENIEVRGLSLSKNDIIDYFDALQQDNVIAYHEVIAADQALLGFLEDHLLEKGARFKNDPLYHDPAFIRWVSPYFRDAFRTFTDGCFKDTDAEGLKTLLDNPLLMTGSDEEGAWSGIFKVLDSNISRLDYYHNQNRAKGARLSVTLDDVSPILSFQYISLIQVLPETRFGMLRDKYAFAAMEAAIYAFNRNTADRSLAMIWVETATPLAVSPDIRNALDEKLDEMQKLQKKRKRSMAFRGAWLALILVRMLTCNNWGNDDTDIMRHAPVYFNKAGDSTLLRLLKHDSTLPTLHDSIRPLSDTTHTGTHSPITRLPDSISTK